MPRKREREDPASAAREATELLRKAATLALRPDCPPRDALQIREGILKIVNANVWAYEGLDRTLTDEETQSILRLGKLLDDAVKDLRVEQTKGLGQEDKAKAQLGEILRLDPDLRAYVRGVLAETGDLLDSVSNN